MIKKEQKLLIIDKVVNLLSNYKTIYLINIFNMNVSQINILRKMCFDYNVIFLVVKNTLLKKSFNLVNENKYSAFYSILNNNTTLMISKVENLPAKIIANYKSNVGSVSFPLFKGAYVQDTFYIGQEQFEYLLNIKTREELIINIINSLSNMFNSILFSVTSCNNLLLLSLFQKNTS
jgi:large subunit ribosomal protein L10